MSEIKLQLPESFCQRLEKIVPDDQLSFVLDSFHQVKQTTFRINTLAADRDAILARLGKLEIPLTPIPWVTDRLQQPLAFSTDSSHRQQLTHSPVIDAGEIYLQNLSSMLAAVVMDAQPDEQILDLAAAPGGKTIHLAQQMENTGTLAAVEVVRGRMFKLQANLRRCRVSNCRTYLTDGRTVGAKTPERFDRVLLDAPCSSEARFRAGDPKTWEQWSPRKLRETARKQIGLLKSAIRATKPGGTILYCTCSFAPEENEAVLTKILKKFDGLIDILPVDVPLENVMAGIESFDGIAYHPQVLHALRILPNEIMDGFFLAKLQVKKM